MFRITEHPVSGSLEQCLAKNCKYDSIVSVDMDTIESYLQFCNCNFVIFSQALYKAP